MLTFPRLLRLLMLAVTLNAWAFMAVNPDRIVGGTDSPEYDLMARQLVADRGYTLEAEAPFLPTVWREPGYPLMVSVVYRLVGPSPDVVAGLQAVLLGLTAGLVALIGAQLFGPAVGLVGGALFGLSSESAHYAHWLLTEVLFTLLLMSTLAFALRAQSDGRTRDFLAVGIGLGLTTVVRAVAGSVLFPLVVVLGLAQSRAGRRWPLRAGLIVVAMALVVAPWIGRNWAVVGHPVLASRFGVNLVRRAPRAADPPAAYRDWVKASVWMATNPLSQLIVPMSTFQWGPSYEDNLIWDFHVNDMNRHLMWYEPICNPTPDQEACFVPIGLAFVREYPVGYVVQTVFELVKLHFAPLPGPQALIHNTTVWLGVVAGISLAVRRRLRAPHALVLGSVAAYVAAISLLDTQVRYLLPVLPIYAILAAVPLTSALQTVLRALGAPAGALTSRQANDPVRR